MDDHKKRGGFGSGGRGGGYKGGHGGGFGGGHGGFRPKFGRPGNHEFRKAQMFGAICAECGKPCEVPFRPTGDKPVFCSYCFGKNRSNESAGGRDGGQTAELKKQIYTLSVKVDVLIGLITNNIVKSAVQTPVQPIEITPVSKSEKKEKSAKPAKKSLSKKK
jgi:CxxC-x17-CxxC domain-containing protein